MSENNHVRSVREVQRGLLKMAFDQNRPGVVIRMQERREKVAKETMGARELIARFTLQHFVEDRESCAAVLIAQREGGMAHSPFSLAIPPGRHMN